MLSFKASISIRFQSLILLPNLILLISSYLDLVVSEETPYAGGHFRVKLVLSKNFPSEPPKGFFLTKIFHPNIANNGEICVNTLKKDWKPDYGIKHILLVSVSFRILMLDRATSKPRFFPPSCGCARHKQLPSLLSS